MDSRYFSTESMKREVPPHFRGSGLFAIGIKIPQQWQSTQVPGDGCGEGREPVGKKQLLYSVALGYWLFLVPSRLGLNVKSSKGPVGVSTKTPLTARVSWSWTWHSRQPGTLAFGAGNPYRSLHLNHPKQAHPILWGWQPGVANSVASPKPTEWSWALEPKNLRFNSLTSHCLGVCLWASYSTSFSSSMRIKWNKEFKAPRTGP